MKPHSHSRSAVEFLAQEKQIYAFNMVIPNASVRIESPFDSSINVHLIQGFRYLQFKPDTRHLN